jgi:hypothetical protein
MATGDRKDPYNGYNFKLEIDGISRNGFRECAGIDAGGEPIEYREGNEKVFTARKLPGLIKYSPITLQRKPDGTVLLETQGFPGESFDIEASIDLLNWLDLGTVLADTNGLMQFDDTNAPNFPSRFYYTNPQ